MANSSAIFKKGGKIDQTELISLLQEINKDNFNNVLDISLDGDSILIQDKKGYLISVWWYESSPYFEYTNEGEEKEVSEDFYSMDEVPSPDYNFWILTYIQKLLTRKSDYVFYYEGIGEYSDKGDKLVTTFEKFIKRMTNHGGGKIQKFIDKRLINSKIKYNREVAKSYSDSGEMSQELYHFIFG